MSLSPKGDTHCPSPKGESPKGDTHKLHKQKIPKGIRSQRGKIPKGTPTDGSQRGHPQTPQTEEQKGTPNLGRFHMKSAARGASDHVVGPLCDDGTNKAFALIWEFGGLLKTVAVSDGLRRTVIDLVTSVGVPFALPPLRFSPLRFSPFALFLSISGCPPLGWVLNGCPLEG